MFCFPAIPEVLLHELCGAHPSISIPPLLLPAPSPCAAGAPGLTQQTATWAVTSGECFLPCLTIPWFTGERERREILSIQWSRDRQLKLCPVGSVLLLQGARRLCVVHMATSDYETWSLWPERICSKWCGKASPGHAGSSGKATNSLLCIKGISSQCLCCS